MARARAKEATADPKVIGRMVKKGASLGEVAKELGLTVGQVAPEFYRQEVEQGVIDEIDAKNDRELAKKIVVARDKQGLRWERLAAATGLGVARVKTLYEEGGGDLSDTYTGKGRNFNAVNGGSVAKAKTTKAKASKAKVEDDDEDTPRRGRGRPAAASSRRQSGSASGGTRRARTRDERRARSNDPS